MRSLASLVSAILCFAASVLFSAASFPGGEAVGSTQPPGSLDLAFDAGFGAFPTEIRNVVVHPDGRILVCGFALYVGAEYYPDIAQFHPNGGVDGAFVPAPGGHNGIYGLARQRDGKILFGSVPGDGDPNARLVRRLNADGSPDTGFIPFQGGFFGWGKVLVELGNGQILMGGCVTLEEGSTGLLRFHEDGRRDTNFAPVVLDMEGPEVRGESRVNALAVEPEGRILIAGRFSTIGGRNHKGLARLHADGTLDEDFVHTADLGLGNNPLEFMPTNDRASLSTLLRLPDGSILVGGSFDRIQGLFRTNLARLNADGSIDPGFDVGRGLDGEVRACARQVDGKILIAGAFSRVDGVLRPGIARLHPEGALDVSFDPGFGADAPINTLAVQPDGGILIGGAFTSVNGVPRMALARLHGHGALRFTHLSRQPDGSLDLTLSTQPTKRYALERSMNLATWTSSQTNAAPGYLLQFNDTPPIGTTSVFYRVRLIEPGP